MHLEMINKYAAVNVRAPCSFSKGRQLSNVKVPGRVEACEMDVPLGALLGT